MFLIGIRNYCRNKPVVIEIKKCMFDHANSAVGRRSTTSPRRLHIQGSD